MKALHVWWDEEHVGELTTQEDVLRFRYSSSASRRISRSLPVTTEWQAGRFFANLLPDGGLREALARRFGVSADNDFALLEKVGGDCAGALTLLPEGEEPKSLPQGKEALPLSRIKELAAGEAGLVQALAQGRARLSLAGAQGKIPVILDDGELWTPVGGTPSTHILKLPNDRLKRISVNELFMLDLARELGLPVVEARLWPVGDENALLVTRFDRKNGLRLHQEDFCQATNRPPRTKYEDEGGPTFSEIVTVIREESAEPAVDVDVALNWLIFNVLCGNADGHAKNLALLRSAPVRLAPLYDLVCTRYWDNFGADVAIGVGGQRDPGHIDKSHWAKLAKDAGLGAPFVARRVEEMVGAAPRAADRIAQKRADSGVDTAPFDRLTTIVADLCRRAAQLLAAGSGAATKNANESAAGVASGPGAKPDIFRRARPRASR